MYFCDEQKTKADMINAKKIKEEQINFFLEDVEKKLDEYKRAIDTKDKQLSDIKKNYKGRKKAMIVT